MKNEFQDDILNMMKKNSKYASFASMGLVSDTTWWIDTGSYMFNALLSSDFFKGFPGNKIVAFAGPNSSGKTFLTMHILKNFQNLLGKNIIIYLDSEGSITTDILLDTKIDIKRFFHDLVENLNEFKVKMYNFLDGKEKFNTSNNYFLVLDSLGSLGVKDDMEKVLKGKDTPDMGLRAKYISEMFRTITIKLSVLQQPMLITSHTYETMSPYQMKGISGGNALQYAANVIIELTPSKIRCNNEIIGTNITAKLRKSRSSIQWKTVDLALMYKTGLSRYYGLLDFALKYNYFQKEGNKIKIKNEKIVSKKEIEENPEKYFTKDVLVELNVYAKEEFEYGEENMNSIYCYPDNNVNDILNKFDMK